MKKKLKLGTLLAARFLNSKKRTHAFRQRVLRKRTSIRPKAGRGDHSFGLLDFHKYKEISKRNEVDSLVDENQSEGLGNRETLTDLSVTALPVLRDEKVNSESITPELVPQLKPVELRPMSAGLSFDSLIHPDEKLRDAIASFLLDQRSEHTRRSYAKDLKRFVDYLRVRVFQQNERLNLLTINRSVIVSYKEYLLGEKLQHSTVDRHLASLRSFFGWLHEDGVIATNPADGVRFLNQKKLSTTQGFSDEEVARVLAIPDLHTQTGALHYAILMVLFYAGVRRSELCSLKMKNLTEERGFKVFRLTGKGNKERLIVLAEGVWNAIQYYFKMTRKNRREPDQYVFTPVLNNRTHELNKPLDASMIFYIVTRYAKKAGIMNRVSPHSCRATAISNARDHLVPDRAIQEFAGWASPDMITRYDKRKSAIEKSAAHSISYGAEDRVKVDDET